jgi:hypothetical protein
VSKKRPSRSARPRKRRSLVASWYSTMATLVSAAEPRSASSFVPTQAKGVASTVGWHGVRGQVVDGAGGGFAVAGVAEHAVGEREQPRGAGVARQTVVVGEVLVDEGLVDVFEGSVPAQLPDRVVRGAFERRADARPIDRGHGHAAAVHGQGPGVVRAVDERLHAEAEEVLMRGLRTSAAAHPSCVARA